VFKLAINEITMFECSICYKTHRRKEDAGKCYVYHKEHEQILKDFFEKGLTLGQIAENYDIWKLSKLTEAQKKITKDNCFVVEYLQICKKPAYKIKDITPKGIIIVGGVGGWSGYYSSPVDISCLKDPRPKEELFIKK
jgi:hypothetical protein